MREIKVAVPRSDRPGAERDWRAFPGVKSARGRDGALYTLRGWTGALAAPACVVRNGALIRMFVGSLAFERARDEFWKLAEATSEFLF